MSSHFDRVACWLLLTSITPASDRTQLTYDMSNFRRSKNPLIIRWRIRSSSSRVLWKFKIQYSIRLEAPDPYIKPSCSNLKMDFFLPTSFSSLIWKASLHCRIEQTIFFSIYWMPRLSQNWARWLSFLFCICINGILPFWNVLVYILLYAVWYNQKIRFKPVQSCKQYQRQQWLLDKSSDSNPCRAGSTHDKVTHVINIR